MHMHTHCCQSCSSTFKHSEECEYTYSSLECDDCQERKARREQHKEETCKHVCLLCSHAWEHTLSGYEHNYYEHYGTDYCRSKSLRFGLLCDACSGLHRPLRIKGAWQDGMRSGRHRH